MTVVLLDQGAVERYMSAKLGSPVTVKKLKRTFPGNSRETWFVIVDRAGTEEGFVLRIDPPEGSGGPSPLRFEWDVYERLYKTEVPVAEPLWYDEGGEFAEGRPLMVRRLVDGSSNVPGLGAAGAEGDALRKKIAYECIEQLARVHLLDWKAAGFADIMPVPPSPAQAFRMEFDIWRGYWNKGQPYADPVLDEALVWLSENIPTDTPFVSLLKGNNGVGEEIWRDNKIVAMSDWELSTLSDGISDMFWSQGTASLIGFDAALRHYESCIGHKVSSERIAYASLFAMAKQMVCSVVFWHAHQRLGRTQRIYSLSTLSFMAEIRHRLGQCIGKSLPDAWRTINGGSDKSLYISAES